MNGIANEKDACQMELWSLLLKCYYKTFCPYAGEKESALVNLETCARRTRRGRHGEALICIKKTSIKEIESVGGKTGRCSLLLHQFNKIIGISQRDRKIARHIWGFASDEETKTSARETMIEAEYLNGTQAKYNDIIICELVENDRKCSSHNFFFGSVASCFKRNLQLIKIGNFSFLHFCVVANSSREKRQTLIR